MSAPVEEAAGPGVAGRGLVGVGEDVGLVGGFELASSRACAVVVVAHHVVGLEVPFSWKNPLCRR